MKQWFVGITNDQKEGEAAEKLRDRGLAVYVPKTHTRCQEGRSIRATTSLRFTGYIFVQCDVEKNEHATVNGSKYIDRLLGTSEDGKPSPLRPGTIQTLRAIEDEDYFRAVARKTPKPRTDIVPGDTVEVVDKDHKFFGKQGGYLGTEKGHARVLFHFIVLKIEQSAIRKVERAEKKRAG